MPPEIRFNDEASLEAAPHSTKPLSLVTRLVTHLGLTTDERSAQKALTIILVVVVAVVVLIWRR